MGTYVYRVTSTTVRCSDGQIANIAIFAFKPCWDSKFDTKWNFKSGCVASDRMAAKGNITRRVVMGTKNEQTGKIEVYPETKVFQNLHNLGSFYDDTLGMVNQFPKVEGVSV